MGLITTHRIADSLSAAGHDVTIKKVLEWHTGKPDPSEVRDSLQKWKKQRAKAILDEAEDMSRLVHSILEASRDVAYIRHKRYVGASLYGMPYAEDARAVARSYRQLLKAAGRFFSGVAAFAAAYEHATRLGARR